MNTTIKFLFALILLLQSGAGQDESLAHLQFSLPKYGTAFQAVLFHENENQLEQLKVLLLDKLNHLELVFSSYNKDSELNHLALTQATHNIKLSDDLYACLAISQDVFIKSSGLFDPSVGSWTQLWKKARGQIGMNFNGQEVIKNDFNKLILLEHRFAYFENDAFLIDLGGIAKGYVLDQCAIILNEHNCIRFYLSLGGEVMVGKGPPGKDGWTIACEGPGRKVVTYLNLSEKALSSSGSSYQFIWRDGKKISHIYQPDNGKSSDHPNVAYVIAQQSSHADAWATVLQIKGSTNILKMARPEIEWGGLLSKQGWSETTGDLP